MHSTDSGELWCMGQEALRAFSQVATHLAICGNTSKSKALADLYGHLSHSLIRYHRYHTPTLWSRWMCVIVCIVCVVVCAYVFFMICFTLKHNNSYLG